jgi:hypothetical protein
MTLPCVGVYEGKTAILQIIPTRGDVNRDGVVDIFDVVLIAGSYGSRSGDPEWLAVADIAPEWNHIDIYDLVTCTRLYGKTWSSYILSFP